MTRSDRPPECFYSNRVDGWLVWGAAGLFVGLAAFVAYVFMRAP